MNILKRLFGNHDRDDTNKLTEQKSSASAKQFQGYYFNTPPSDNDKFINEFKSEIYSVMESVKTGKSDRVILITAFEEEKWRALLALIYKYSDKLYFSPEDITGTNPKIQNNGYCNVYIAPYIEGKQLKVGIYSLERDLLVTQLCWLKGLPPVFITLVKDEIKTDHFTVVVLNNGGMCVRQLPQTIVVDDNPENKNPDEANDSMSEKDAGRHIKIPASDLKLKLFKGMKIEEVHEVLGPPHSVCTWTLIGCNYHEVWRTTNGRLRVFYNQVKIVEKWAVES